MPTVQSFHCEHTPSKSRLFALIEQDGRMHLRAILTLPDAKAVERLARLFGAVTRNRTLDISDYEVKEQIGDVSGPILSAALQALEKTVKNSWENNDAVPKDLTLISNAWALAFMPAARDSLDDNEDEGFTLTPRSACLLNAACEVLGDAIYDVANEIHQNEDLEESSFGWRLPGSMTEQDEAFVRKFARCFDYLIDDMRSGEYPVPSSMAEEIALDMALSEVERFVQDEPEFVLTCTIDLPQHPSDDDLLEWGHAELFQDRDFEGHLSGRAAPAGSLEYLWDEFSNTRSRDPDRPYRRSFHADAL